MFAFELVSERFGARIGALRPDGPAAHLRAILLELLPLSAEARAEAPVLAAFLAQAVVEPRLGESLRRGSGEMVAWLAGLITSVRPGGDAERDAMGLLAFVDGLMLQVLIGQVSPADAEELVDHQLARVLTCG